MKNIIGIIWDIESFYPKTLNYNYNFYCEIAPEIKLSKRLWDLVGGNKTDGKINDHRVKLKRWVKFLSQKITLHVKSFATDI